MLDLTVTVLILVLLGVLFSIFNAKKYKRPNLPGPKGVPFIGSIFDVNFKAIHLTFYEWSKTYGDIFHINLFGRPFVVINSPKIIRELFSKEPNATLTAARPDTFARYFLHTDEDVVLGQPTKQWTKRRKLTHKLLHAYGEGLQYIEQRITKHLSEFRRELSTSDQIECDPQDLVEDFVLSILQILMVGHSSGRGNEFQRYVRDLLSSGNEVASNGLDILYFHVPLIRYLPFPPTKSYRTFVKLRNEMLKIFESHTENSDAGIYQSMKKCTENDDKGRPLITETVLQSMLLNLLGGGFLTTKSLLLSMIQILMSKPDVQNKLQVEVDRVIGRDRQPSLSDRYAMHFHEAVILETLRLITQTPFGILHAAADDVLFGDIVIPKGITIVPNLWGIHHSDKEWKDPFTFNPERFLDEKGELLPADHEIRKRFLGFGIGKRSCIGEVFAKSRAFLFLATLTQTCTVQPPDGNIPKTMDPRNMIPGSIMMPEPFTCNFMARKVCT